MISSDISAPCYFCGRPAQPQVHHGRPEDTSQGKGTGGDPAGLLDHERHDLCDDHHKGVHAKRCAFRVENGMVELLAPGDEGSVIGRRGLVLSDEEVCGNCHHWGSQHDRIAETRWPCYVAEGCDCKWLVLDHLLLSDIALSEAWAKADSQAVTALQAQCEIAWALKERYAHTTHKWYERAAEILSEQGKHVHWRRVYERCRYYATYGPTAEYPRGRWEAMEKLGATVALAVANVSPENRPAALELALDLNAKFKPALEITAAIKGDVAETAKETHVCGEGEGCGHRHQRAKGD